ncbi:hypothetical protein HED51_17995 [Ochrobactrum grignonense]|nr:hypothetical protein [Brucella grignonensis]
MSGSTYWPKNSTMAITMDAATAESVPAPCKAPYDKEPVKTNDCGRGNHESDLCIRH